MKNRKVSKFHLLLYIITAAALFLTSPAHALLPIVSCVGDIEVSYSPGVTNTPAVQDVEGTTTYGLCTTLIGFPLVTSGVAETELQTELDCQSLLEPSPPGVKTVTWNDGATTTWSFNSPVVVKLQGQTIMTRTGTVTSGRYNGKAVQENLTWLTSDLDACFTSGITHAQGAATLLIL